MHIGSIQFRMLGVIVIGTICSCLTVAALPNLSVALRPTSLTISAGGASSFTATVTGSTNTAVNWTVDGIPNGNGTVGTVNGSGNTITYIAPMVSGSHILKAASRANASKSSSSLITVAALPVVTSVAVNPATLALNTGAQSAFKATITGTRTNICKYSQPPAGAADHGWYYGNIVPQQMVGPDGVTPCPVLVTTSQVDINAPHSEILYGPGSYTASIWLRSTTKDAVMFLQLCDSTSGWVDMATAFPVLNPNVWQRVSLTGSLTQSLRRMVLMLRVAGGRTVALGPCQIESGKVATDYIATGATPVTVSTSYSSGVTWSAKRGSITSAGLYTAPATSGSDVVTATSVADATKTASVSVTVGAASAITSVVATPATSSISPGAQIQLSATVTGTGSYSSGVLWSAQRGSVSSGGLYTAPSTAGSDVVTATSVADATKTATVLLTISATSTITSVSVNPATSSLDTGGQSQFSATVAGTGSYSSGVTWSAQLGTITSGGLYTASSTPGSDVVTATSVADSSKSASAAITISNPMPLDALLNLFVSPAGGTAARDCSKDHPTTLEEARDYLRTYVRSKTGILRVWMRGGLYLRTTTFDLTAADTGSQANPIEYVAYGNEVPRLVGGVSLDPVQLKVVDASDANLTRLDPAVRSHVWVADLTSSGDLGALDSRMNNKGAVNKAAEFFVDGAAMTLARYPDAVDPESVVLAKKDLVVRVGGNPTPDVTGDYAYGGVDWLGRPYYLLQKGGDTWTISGHYGDTWRLSNRGDLGGKGTPAQWQSGDGFAGPLGRMEASTGAAKGTALLEPADGSQALPGFMMIRTTDGSTSMSASGHTNATWAHPEEAMLYGFYFYSWWAGHVRPSQIQASGSSILLPSAPPFGIRVGQPCFVYNVLEELTAPGECYVDPRLHRLYLYPPSGQAPGEILVSMLQTPVLRMRQVKYLTWKGVTFEVARDVLADAQGCESVSFLQSVFRNAGGKGLLLNGSRNVVDGCTVYGLGKGGIQVSGGDRYQLVPSESVIQNCDIHHVARLFWTYEPAVRIGSLVSEWQEDCVGVTVQQNEFHHLPHEAIEFLGNNHTMRWNNIHHACQWANDAGAVYGGRDWGGRGNLIQGNLFRNNYGPMGAQVCSVYMDDTLAGTTVEGNIFYNSSPDFALEHGGGRDTIIRYNIFYGHWAGAITDNRGAWHGISSTAGDSWNMLEKLRKFNYQAPPWSTAYPELAAIPNDYAQLQTGSHWLQPEGCVLVGNLQFGNTSTVARDEGGLAWFKQVEQNLAGVDPLFTNAAGGDFTLRQDSSLRTVRGFPGIDVSKIGIQK